jgi:ArsR family transcriptional regulator
MARQPKSDDATRFAEMLAAIGTEPRLCITRLLLTAHPEGLVAGEIQDELGVSASNLSHHLERLKHAGVIAVKREGTFLRYTANTEALRELLSFLFDECCTRNRAIEPDKIINISK